jgi:hypothetical protein
MKVGKPKDEFVIRSILFIHKQIIKFNEAMDIILVQHYFY